MVVTYTKTIKLGSFFSLSLQPRSKNPELGCRWRISPSIFWMSTSHTLTQHLNLLNRKPGLTCCTLHDNQGALHFSMGWRRDEINQAWNSSLFQTARKLSICVLYFSSAGVLCMFSLIWFPLFLLIPSLSSPLPTPKKRTKQITILSFYQVRFYFVFCFSC